MSLRVLPGTRPGRAEATPTSSLQGAAGERVASERLRVGYERCADITRAHGTTYWWGTQLLAPAQRRDVYAVYALCRLADDIVDEPEKVGLLDGTHVLTPGSDGDAIAARDAAHDDGPGLDGYDLDPRLLASVRGVGPKQRLEAFEAWFRDSLAAGPGRVDDPIMAAIVDTITRRDIPLDCFDRFFGAMRLDLTRDSWASWAELRDGYMEGSAAVIGEMMLPVLEPADREAARGPARALGLAFQLTNFLRDVGEDLDRGRVYLPADELAAYGADPWSREVTPAWRAFLAAQIARNRELYEQARPGIDLLPGASGRCVAVAHRMYSEILTRIERADYDVFSQRQRVSRADKAIVVADVLARGAGTAPAFDPDVREERGGSRLARVLARPDIPIKRMPQPDEAHLRTTWRQASVPRIAKALRRAQQRDPGGWHVVGASTDVGATSVVRTVLGREVVLWRGADGRFVAGPGECPHMGASLHGCTVVGSSLLCRWHGLALNADGDRLWSPYPALDDGVLLWVRLPTPGEEPADAPTLTARPPAAASIASVIAVPGRCEPADIIANRLDPWHGAWFHPYAFSHLVVDEEASTDDRLVTDVTFRLDKTWGVPVTAEFTCPDARTIAMHITKGEGAGSVVETHATPFGVDCDGRPLTMMVEATVAHSPRPGFALARRLAPIVRPLMERTQRQLWVDDLEYAERRHLVRARRIERRAERTERPDRLGDEGGGPW
ncbi:DUF5914 domain-containing protein [Agilicoccus flavus]|uniref:DUF5914 domain-containing protein n=1 Tax=Agilicoccus flavus TaxID=2775968 RepID=UPI001CF62531|nr:DUF5914 domain-containing protein [Agilicoccus flavus]